MGQVSQTKHLNYCKIIRSSHWNESTGKKYFVTGIEYTFLNRILLICNHIALYVLIMNLTLFKAAKTSISEDTFVHYNGVIMGAIASQIISPTIVYSIVYSDADQRKQQSSASLAFVWEFTGEFPAQMASYAENVYIWWRHHAVLSREPEYEMNPP